MLNALLLLAAVSFGQQTIEKIPIQHVPAQAVYDYVTKNSVDARIIYDPTDNSILVQGNADAIKHVRKLIAEIDQAQLSRTVALKNVAAQYVLDLLKSAGDKWLPAGAIVSLDARSNAIIVRGSEGAVRETELLIQQFDIKGVQVSLDVQALAPQIHRDFTVSGTVANNSSLDYRDEPTATALKFSPKVSSDKSIVLVVSGGILGSTTKAYLKMKPGEALLLVFSPITDGPNPGMRVSRYFDVPDDAIGSTTVKARLFESEIDQSSGTPPSLAELRLLIKATIREN